jgi:hypothetical protein
LKKQWVMFALKTAGTRFSTGIWALRFYISPPFGSVTWEMCCSLS